MLPEYKTTTTNEPYDWWRRHRASSSLKDVPHSQSHRRIIYIYTYIYILKLNAYRYIQFKIIGLTQLGLYITHGLLQTHILFIYRNIFTRNIEDEQYNKTCSLFNSKIEINNALSSPSWLFVFSSISPTLPHELIIFYLCRKLRWIRLSQLN